MIFILMLVSSLLFIMYGLLCIFSKHMVEEFERYGLKQFRLLVGYLELLGGLGQIVGYYFYPPLFIAATLGITVLMFMAIGLRTKLRDPIHQVLPALLLFALNAYLLCDSLGLTFM